MPPTADGAGSADPYPARAWGSVPVASQSSYAMETANNETDGSPKNDLPHAESSWGADTPAIVPHVKQIEMLEIHNEEDDEEPLDTPSSHLAHKVTCSAPCLG